MDNLAETAKPEHRVSRRRLLAAFSALGLMSEMAFSKEKKTEIWTCRAGLPTYQGYHELKYHLKDGRPTHVTATMLFDLSGLAWTDGDLVINGEDSRGFAGDLYSGLEKSEWATQMRANLARRKTALDKIPDGPKRESLATGITSQQAAVFLATDGWLALQLRNPPGRSDTLVPEAIEVQFPPLGKSVGLTSTQIAIEAYAGEQRIESWTYKVKGIDADLAGVGPAPHVKETDPKKLQKLITLLGAGKPLLFRAKDQQDKALFELQLKAAFDWKEEYAVLGSLIPDAKQAAQALVTGQYQDYHDNHGDLGGICEKSACFLTTATVDAIGLADDCWELSTLRRFRDKWLSRQPFGKALIAEYYRLAPALVARINARADARRIWLKTWLWGILPAAFAARIGTNRLALAIYRRMTRRLGRLADLV